MAVSGKEQDTSLLCSLW